MSHQHVIPIPPGRTPEDVWEELCQLGKLEPRAPKDCQWATIECNGTECLSIEEWWWVQ